MAAPSNDLAEAGNAIATFVQALSTRDAVAPPLSKAEARTLIKQLNRTFNSCSTSNVKLSTSFIISIILPSRNRTDALENYVLRLTGLLLSPRDLGYTVPQNADPQTLEILDHQNSPLPAWRRLHALNLFGNVLFVLHGPNNIISYKLPQDRRADAYAETKNLTFGLFDLVNCYGYGKDLTQQQRLIGQRWVEAGIYSKKDLSFVLHDAVDMHDPDWFTDVKDRIIDSDRDDDNKMDIEMWQNNGMEQDITLPRRHGIRGDDNPSWVDLPASNAYYVGATRGFFPRAGAIPKGGFELRHGGQRPDPELKKDADDLLKELLHAHDEHTDADEVADIDELGNVVWRDPNRATRNNLGFSPEGLKKAKENQRRLRENAAGYDGVLPLASRDDPFSQVDAAVERARQLAGGRGGQGFERGGYRGRGYRGGNWRGGAPRGGFRGRGGALDFFA